MLAFVSSIACQILELHRNYSYPLSLTVMKVILPALSTTCKEISTLYISDEELIFDVITIRPNFT